MFARLCSDYAELIQALRDRADQIQISRLEIDEIAGLQSGYSSKLLAQRPGKIFGPISLGPMIQTLGLRLLFIEDGALTAKTLARRTPREECNVRYPNGCELNLASALASIEPTQQHQSQPAPVSRAHLRVVQMKRGRKYG